VESSLLSAAAKEAIDDCVHCGFCLPACPTYQLWQREPDSPRGRIQLLNARLEGRVPVDSTFTERFDNCLGCLACMTACPSGVRYDHVLERARTELAASPDRPRPRRALASLSFALFPHRRRLRRAAIGLAAYQRSGVSRLLRSSGVWKRLPAELRALESLAPRLRISDLYRSLPASSPAPAHRGTVVLLQGCVQSVFFPRVNAATIRVLNAEGFDVLCPPEQGCCGALSLHEGRRAEGAEYARRLVESTPLDSVSAVIVNAAGCGSAMRHYGDLLREGDGGAAARAETEALSPDTLGDADRFAGAVRDIAEFLAALEPAAQRHPLKGRIAYHDACHLSHAQGVRSAPRALLASVPGLDVHELADRDRCCGSAGLYNVFQPDAAATLGRMKADNVIALGVDAVVSGNPGCSLQLERHLRERTSLPPQVLHTVEVLDASIRRVPLWQI
jgi:glycolate oxidase iron-sulfur subunit